jgi:hypothetical protein
MNNQRIFLIKITSVILLLTISCSSSKQSNSKVENFCNENFDFKKEFFENINNVENLIEKSQNESFRNSLKFIGKYASVSFESMANYARTYPIGIFEKDKKVWLEWYENNKCKSIKFKE